MNQFKKYLVNNSITSGGLVELGCGNGADAEFAAESGLSPVIAVDIHKSDNIKEARFVHGNYLSDSVFKSVCGILGLHRIKFLHSAFSLCFNKKEKIEEYLPRYFNLLENGGVFFLSDFGDKEEIVVNRTHLLSPWFLTLLNRYFDEVRIEEESVFEPDHAHTHCIFTLIAIKKSSTTIEQSIKASVSILSHNRFIFDSKQSVSIASEYILFIFINNVTLLGESTRILLNSRGSSGYLVRFFKKQIEKYYRIGGANTIC